MVQRNCAGASPPFILNMLGPMEVRVDGASLPHLRSRKGLWLLALLALRQGRAVERTWLVDTLWPQSSECQAHYNLRQCLTDLRRALGVQSGRVKNPSRHTLALDLDGAGVDLLAFDAEVRQTDPAALARCVELYRGPLLEGCAEEWILPERTTREQEFLRALERLAEHAGSAGDSLTAAGYLRRAVAVDPLHESAHRSLMRALASGGERAEAIQVYRDLRMHLLRELQIEPTEKTRALFEQIRADAICPAAAPESRTRRPANPHAAPDAARQTPRLPARLTRFYGREEEIAALRELLTPASPIYARLVTITGSAGVGKTRLAIETAVKQADVLKGHLWFVPLASVSDPSLISGTILDALHVCRGAGRNPMDQAVAYLNALNAPGLLILDNYEHLLSRDCASNEDGALVARALLERVDCLTLLVTSRERLNLEGEQEYPVAPLPIPDIGELCSEPPENGSLNRQRNMAFKARCECPSVQLFVDRARLRQPAFALIPSNAAVVAAICARLEGIPLALELAAARSDTLPLEEILDQLDDRFELLVSQCRDAVPRHRSLRAAVSWSDRLLPPDVRQFFVRLSVFRGGWTVEAAAEIGMQAETSECPTPIAEQRDPLDCTRYYLEHLQESSLIMSEERGGDIWFRTLETLREYAWEQLSREDQLAARIRHRDYYLALAEEAERQSGGPNQSTWFDRLETANHNLRAALTLCLEQENGSDAGLRMAVAMFPFWTGRCHEMEGRRWLEAVITGSVGVESLTKRRALNCAGNMAFRQGDHPRAIALFEASLALCRAACDKLGMAHALLHLGAMAFRHDELARSVLLLNECLALYGEAGDRHGTAWAYWNLGIVSRYQCDLDRAQMFCENALAVHDQLNDRNGMVWPLISLAETAHARGDDARAVTILQQSLDLAAEVGNRAAAALALNTVGLIALGQKEYGRARKSYEEALSVYRERGDDWCMPSSLNGLGLALLSEGDVESAEALFHESLQLLRVVGDTARILDCLDGFARIAVARREVERAVRLLGTLAVLRSSAGAEYRQRLAAMHDMLDSAEMEAGWAEGMAMTLDQAAAYALEKVPDAQCAC